MDKATKLKVFRRTLRLIKDPKRFTIGHWVSSDTIDLDGDDERAAYEAGRRKQAGANAELQVCVEGGRYLAAGELGVPFDDVVSLIRDINKRAEEAYLEEYETALQVNDTEGQEAIVEVLERTIKEVGAE